jgi:hypothetical protein
MIEHLMVEMPSQSSKQYAAFSNTDSHLAPPRVWEKRSQSQIHFPLESTYIETTDQRFLMQTDDTLHVIIASDVRKGSLPYESQRGMKKGPQSQQLLLFHTFAINNPQSATASSSSLRRMKEGKVHVQCKWYFFLDHQQQHHVSIASHTA